MNEFPDDIDRLIDWSIVCFACLLACLFSDGSVGSVVNVTGANPGVEVWRQYGSEIEMRGEKSKEAKLGGEGRPLKSLMERR